MSVTAVLITADHQLVGTVRKIIDSLSPIALTHHSSFSDARRDLERSDVPLIICHVDSPDDIEEVKKTVRLIATRRQSIATIVIGDDCASTAMDLLRLGVVDYLSRPISLGRLSFLVDSLTLRARHELGARSRRDESVKEKGRATEQIVFSEGSKRLLEQARAVANLDSSVLLTGETGTGKTRLARHIHNSSVRSAKPFVHVDCASIPASLIESELFGHLRGSFTGATCRQAGKCKMAKDGTLFLDEIDALPIESQSRLLRLVDEHWYEPVGGTSPIRLNARIIAASNRDLDSEVQAGRFRQDLFFRLNVFELCVPALRDRKDEIPGLVELFHDDAIRRHNTEPRALSPDVHRALREYDWPGNIRELKNVIERAIVLSGRSIVQLDHLPARIQQMIAGSVEATEYRIPKLSGLARERAHSEVKKIVEVLKRTGNNRSRTAKTLGISREALYKKLHRYHLMDFGKPG